MRKYGIEHFRIILLESYQCSGYEELLKHEDYWSRKLDTVKNGLNSRRVLRTPQERKEDERAKYLKHKHKHKHKNRVRYLQDKKDNVFDCLPCGKTYYGKYNYKIHLMSKKHTRLLREYRIDCIKTVRNPCDKFTTSFDDMVLDLKLMSV